MRVAVIQQAFVPHYRVRFFELLHERSEIEYVVFHGPPPEGTGHAAAPGPFAFPNVTTRTRQLEVAGAVLMYQPVVRRLMATRWDGIVVAPWLRVLSNLLLVPLFKARGRAVIAWGHGYEKDEDHGAPVAAGLRAAARLKRAFARSVDGYLLETYTARGAEHLAAIGVPPERIHPVRNTLDMGEQIALQERMASAEEPKVRESLGLRRDSAVFLCVGRVYPEKRVGELVDAMRRARALAATPIEAVIIGDGPELEAVRADAAGLDGIHILGAIQDQKAIARYMRVAAAMVVPGAVGLVVNHALAHGVPMVTRETRRHGPEVDYIEPGVNGLIVPGGLDDLAAAIAELADSPALRRTLAEGALRTRSALGLDEMVEAFDRGVITSLGARSRR